MESLKSVQIFIVLLPAIISSSFVGKDPETFVVKYSSNNFSCDETLCYLNVSSASELIDDLSSLSTAMLRAGRSYGYHSRNLGFFKTIETRPNTTNLEKIPSKLFEKFYSLQTLTMENSGIEELNREDFKAAGSLKELFLSGNKITRIDNMAFLHLKQLRHIDLSRNQIGLINDGSFEEMSENIQEIDLSFNAIKKFKTSFFTLMGAKTNNSLTINLSNNNISEVEPSNSNNSSIWIERLDLQHNRIKSFDSSDLEIRELFLGHNQLENLKLLPSVEQLDVANNNLPTIFISRLMFHLDASHNQIEALDCDATLTLKVLDLSHNKLTSAAIAQLKHAEHFEVLDLSNNPLGALRMDSFADMTSLATLNLANTQLAKISFGLFSHQQHLRELNIAHNDLGFIDHHMFTSLEELEIWNISGNSIWKLRDHEIFYQTFPNLHSIALEDNHWDCEYLSKLRSKFAKQRIEIMNPLQPVKNESNIKGIGCSVGTENNGRDAVESEIDDLNVVVAYLFEQVNELKANENTQNKSISDLKKDVLAMKSGSNQDGFSSNNNPITGDVNEESLIAIHKIETNSGLSPLSIIVLTAAVMILVLFILLGIQSRKNILKMKLRRVYQPSDSASTFAMDDLGPGSSTA